jgi:biopolymer transport protein ExbD
MVTARLIVSRAIPVDSPKTVSGGEVQTTLQLTLRPEKVNDAEINRLYVRGRPVDDWEVARAEVQAAVTGNPQIQAVITADKRVPHGVVMELIDLVKVEGVTRFALTTEEKVKK